MSVRLDNPVHPVEVQGGDPVPDDKPESVELREPIVSVW